MKSKEIIVGSEQVNEAWTDWVPGGETLQQVGAGIKGAVTKGDTFASGLQRKKSEQFIDNHAKELLPSFNQWIVSMRTQKIPDPEIIKEIPNWATNFFKVPGNPFPGTTISGQNAFEYVKTMTAKMLAAQSEAAPTGPTGATGPAPTGPTGPAPTGPAPTGPTGPAPTGPTGPAPTGPTGPAPTGPTGATGPAPEPPPPPEPAPSEIFKDPTKFKEEWDKYVASKGGPASYQLISDPRMLEVLKRLWMRTGGLRAESKQSKGKKI